MSFQKDQAKPNIRKNRNLMNPDKKKRKSNGAKFTQG